MSLPIASPRTPTLEKMTFPLKRTSSAPDLRSGKHSLSEESPSPIIEATSTAFKKMQLRQPSSQEEDDDGEVHPFQTLEKNPTSLSFHSIMRKEKQALLKKAFIHGDKNAAMKLVKEGADVNFRYQGKTLLHLVAKMGQAANVRFLIETLGAKVDANDYRGHTAFHHACIQGHVEVARLLKKLGADINAADPLGRTALHHSCIREHRMMAALLVEEFGADVNAQDKKGFTALHNAIFFSSFEMWKLLIEKLGADVNATCNDERSPLQYALIRGCAVAGTILISDYGADPFHQDKRGRNALHYACTLSHPYFRKGATFFILRHTLRRLFCKYPSYKREIQTQNSLRQEFLSFVNCPDKKGLTPLGLSLSQDDPEHTQILLSFDANPNFLRPLYS
ncbi:MAG: hypothetical protein KR126chlam1_00223 [Chlamydiae bacterium]|nr:hypothetical protein [Chlamydiota bacterium]